MPKPRSSDVDRALRGVAADALTLFIGGKQGLFEAIHKRELRDDLSRVDTEQLASACTTRGLAREVGVSAISPL